MSALLVDLDNTLIDRNYAFEKWAWDFAAHRDGSQSDVDWLLESDRGGYAPRELFATQIRQRFDLADSAERIVEQLLFDHLQYLQFEPEIQYQLEEFRRRGWKIAVVTNGTMRQQTQKIRNLGLDALVDSVLISESENLKKPDRRIFERALQRLDQGVARSWMVGDHPVADIDGARQAGMLTGWVSRGARWPENLEAPELNATCTAEVLAMILAN